MDLRLLAPLLGAPAAASPSVASSAHAKAKGDDRSSMAATTSRVACPIAESCLNMVSKWPSTAACARHSDCAAAKHALEPSPLPAALALSAWSVLCSRACMDCITA